MSQTIRDAEEPETAGYTQESTATVLSAAIASAKGIAPTETPRKPGVGDGRKTAFDRLVDVLGDAIKAARERKQAESKKTEPETAKTLAELLARSAQDSE